VTLTGTNFGSSPGTSSVNFSSGSTSVSAIPMSWSPTSITVAVPSGAPTASNISVTVGSTTSDAVPFTVVSSQWSNGYSHNRVITIHYGQVSNSDQLNFPVLFTGTYSDLATTSNGGYVTSGNGYDIIFTSDPAGTMLLPFEQDSYTASTGAVTFWVQLPVVSHTADTVFYMFYGNPAVTTDQSNKNAVWQYTYQDVWHLGNGTSLNVNDSTSTGIDGASRSATATTGKISGGASFNGSSQYIDLGTYLSFGGNTGVVSNVSSLEIEESMTISAWIKPATSQVTYPQILADGDSSGVTGYNLYLWNSHYPAFIVDANTWGGCFVDSSSSITDNLWHYVVGTYAGGGGAIKIYVDGVLKATSTCPGSPILYTASTSGFVYPQAEIGRKLSPSQSTVYFNGVIDEVRLSALTLSPDWIATEYNSQNSPSSFYAIGSAVSSSSSVPSISSLSPNSGPVGAEIAITGTNFGEDQSTGTVTFNGTLATPTSWSPTSIIVSVPAGASTGNVVVTTNSGSSSGVSFTVTSNPVILSLFPTAGPTGTSVTITGTSLGSSGTVYFNSTSASITSWSSSSIVATVPSGMSGTPSVTVSVSSLTSNSAGFTVTSGPGISYLSPISGAVGDQVVITGTNFGSSGTVTFNGTTASTVSWASTSITAVVPSGATTGNVVVTVGGVSSNGASFTVGDSAYYYFSDALGSERVITNSSGTVCYDGDHDPYGALMALVDTCDSPYKFTGKERDSESNLDYSGARYYASQYARFMTPDPLGRLAASLLNPQTWNQYAYVLNNPIRYSDPTGTCLEDESGNYVDEFGSFCDPGPGFTNPGYDDGAIPDTGSGLAPGPDAPPPDIQIWVTASPDFFDPFDSVFNGVPYFAGNPATSQSRSVFACASETASKVSFSGLLHSTGIVGDNTAGGFISDALAGNTFSGITDLVQSMGTGEAGGHSVFYNMAQGSVAGPSLGLGQAVGAAVPSLKDTPWTNSPVDAASDAIAEGMHSMIDNGPTLIDLAGATSVEGVTAAEFASGVGEAKLIYDGVTYAGALMGCGFGLF
jgi:RHS repeat-associated protein